MSAIRVVLTATIFAATAFAAHAAGAVALPAGDSATVPPAEVTALCKEYGSGKFTAIYILDDGYALKGSADCDAVSFTVSEILPPFVDDGAPVPPVPAS